MKYLHFFLAHLIERAPFALGVLSVFAVAAWFFLALVDLLE